MRFHRIIAATICVTALVMGAEKDSPSRFATGAATGEIQGPVLGYVSSGPGRVRALQGVPGAAILGRDVQAADPASRILASTAQSCFLILENNRVRIACAGEQVIDFPGEGLDPTAPAAFSPSGSDAAVFDAQSSRILVVQGLPRPESTPASWPATIAPECKLAIADGARAVIAWTPTSALVLNGSSSQPLPISARVEHIAFARNSDWAVAASDDGRLWKVESLSTTPVVADLGVTAGTAVTALALSRDSTTLWASTANRILRMDLRTRHTQTLPCPCAVEDLAPLEGNSVFRLTAYGRGPLYLLDGDQPEPRIVFVPADAPALRRDGRAPDRRSAR